MVKDWNALVDKDPDQFDLLSKNRGYVETWVENVLELDKLLTGKNHRRAESDRRECIRMLEGDTWHIHLSDGGFSRVSIDVMDRYIRLDRGLSLERAIKAWDALEG